MINVLTGERYKSITKETAGVLKGEYGAAPAPFNAELQARVLDGAEVITCRPADLLQPEMQRLTADLEGLAREKNIKLAEDVIDDVLTYALFPQIGLKFLENRGNPSAFEPAPTGSELPAREPGKPEVYTVEVNGKSFVVQVNEGATSKASSRSVRVLRPAPSVPVRLQQPFRLVASRRQHRWPATYSRYWCSLGSSFRRVTWW